MSTPFQKRLLIQQAQANQKRAIEKNRRMEEARKNESAAAVSSDTGPTIDTQERAHKKQRLELDVVRSFKNELQQDLESLFAKIQAYVDEKARVEATLNGPVAPADRSHHTKPEHEEKSVVMLWGLEAQVERALKMARVLKDLPDEE